MSQLIFNHPQVRNGRPLSVNVRPDSIEWSYTLNTAHWPTYGGEVVQILSVAIDDVTIQGTVSSYAQMEDIYSYFIEFIQIASQGRGRNAKTGKFSYNQKPMGMLYPHRGWAMKIIPRGLPGFRKGREVVAPQWQLQAYMVDDSDDIEELKQLVLQGTSVQGDDFKLTGAIGFLAENPWSDPFPKKTPDGGQSAVTFDANAVQPLHKEIVDFYDKLIPAWTQGDFSAVTNSFGSIPTALGVQKPATGASQTTVPSGSTAGHLVVR